MREEDANQEDSLQVNSDDTASNQENEVESSIFLKKFMIALVSGVGAGLLCTLVCAPLDVAKIRLQVQGSLGIKKYTGGSISTIRTIYQEEGTRGVFKGVGPAMLTIPLFWGVYWPIYDRLKSHVSEQYPTMNPHSAHLTCAVGAGIVSDIITNPFWVTRTRIQTLALHSEVHVNANITTVEMIRMIYREEGILAFYRGLGASFLGLSHVAIQFPLYEYLKKYCRERREDRKETFFDLLAVSITAKLVASSITYPHEVLRARLQDGRVKKHHSASQRINIFTVTRDVIKKEGIAALWTGIRVNLIRVIPATCTTFVSYEYLNRYLRAKFEMDHV